MCCLGNSSATVRPTKVRFCVPEAQELNADEYDRHRAELAKEWAKGKKRNSDHINVLLRDTFTNRRHWISSLPAGVFGDITTAFPCFEDGEFVSITVNFLHKFVNIVTHSDHHPPAFSKNLYLKKLRQMSSVLYTSALRPKVKVPKPKNYCHGYRCEIVLKQMFFKNVFFLLGANGEKTQPATSYFYPAVPF